MTIHNVRCIDSNVCVAYSITSAYKSNGICITTSGAPVKLSSAYTETLVSANGQVVLDANGEKAFIDFLGFSTCSGGGENIVPTALIQLTNTTATMTSTFSNVPLAAASATLTIAPVSLCRLLATVADERTSFACVHTLVVSRPRPIESVRPVSCVVSLRLKYS